LNLSSFRHRRQGSRGSTWPPSSSRQSSTHCAGICQAPRHARRGAREAGRTETGGSQQGDGRSRARCAEGQAKQQAVKNPKEYNAANREVENKRKAISDREAELKKINEAAGTTTSQLAARDSDVDTIRTELTNSEAAMADQVESLRSQLAEATAVRDAARVQVDKSWLKTYDTLVGKRGYAVAPVVKGVCQGCHMALPPQLNNILARMQSIETCPRCQRLVYRKEMSGRGRRGEKKQKKEVKALPPRLKKRLPRS
jgi:predicted  nucleic acid-binding Zn-ribbon protein